MHHYTQNESNYDKKKVINFYKLRYMESLSNYQKKQLDNFIEPHDMDVRLYDYINHLESLTRKLNHQNHNQNQIINNLKSKLSISNSNNNDLINKYKIFIKTLNNRYNDTLNNITIHYTLWKKTAIKYNFLLKECIRLGGLSYDNLNPILDLVQDVEIPEFNEIDKYNAGVPSQIDV